MKDYEAEQQGFYYTGISSAAWNTEKWEEALNRAKEIKATYKGADFRIVNNYCEGRNGRTLWKDIYGNEIFKEAQYFKPEEEEAWLNDKFPALVHKAEEDYKAKLAELGETYEKRKAKYVKLMGLRKKKK